MSKEINALELTTIKVVEFCLLLAFGNKTKVELMFANHVKSDMFSDAQGGKSHKRQAEGNLDGVYRQLDPFMQSKVSASVMLKALYIPCDVNDEDGGGHFMVWIPETVDLWCEGDWTPEPHIFDTTWVIDKDGGGPDFTVEVHHRANAVREVHTSQIRVTSE